MRTKCCDLSLYGHLSYDNWNGHHLGTCETCARTHVEIDRFFLSIILALSTVISYTLDTEYSNEFIGIE